MPYPLISCIIVNFQSVKTLPACLSSLQHFFPSPEMFEVIVVNNDVSEKDALESMQAQYSFSLIHSPGNIGFGRANNLAAQSAKGRYLFLLNPDSRILRGDLSGALRLLDRSEKGIIGFKLVDSTGTTQPWSSGSKVTLWDIIRNNLGFPKSKHIWQSTVPTDADWVSGAACLLSRSFFDVLRGFDERFFLYFEDVDLCLRAQRQGGRVLYFPQVVIEHSGGQSSSSTHEQKKHFYTSQDLYFHLHRPRWESHATTFLRRLTHFY